MDVREKIEDYIKFIIFLLVTLLYERLKLGWSIEKALLTPSRKVV